MKTFVVPAPLKSKRLKAPRFHIIGVAGRLIQHACGLFIMLSSGIDVITLFEQMRQKIAELAQAHPVLEPL